MYADRSLIFLSSFRDEHTITYSRKTFMGRKPLEYTTTILEISGMEISMENGHSKLAQKLKAQYLRSYQIIAVINLAKLSKWRYYGVAVLLHLHLQVI